MIVALVNANVVNELTYCQVNDYRLLDGWTYWLPFVM